jgi:iron complex outermembrane receptor protein
MFKPSRLAICLSAAFGAAMVSAPSIAQQQPEAVKLERIEITGSRIRQIDTETAQPVLKVTAADIQKSGLVSVGDIVNQLSSAGSPAFSRGSVLTSNREQGGQYANLRNLGSQRLLVLVNGRRWSTTVGGFTDLSTIPSSMVERVEILKDGASSIYGSDAIAGVMNFILKKSMDGGEASAYYGQNEKGDGTKQEYRLAYGASSEKASVILGFTHLKEDPVFAKDRPITSFSFGDARPTAALGGGPWGRIRFVNPATGGALTGAGAIDRVLNHTGSFDGVGVGQASNNQANYHANSAAIVDDLFNPTQQMMFQSPTELRSIFAKGSLDVAPSIRLNTTAMYAERLSNRQVAGMPFNSQSQPGNPVYLDKDSFFNPYGNQGVGVTPGTGRDLFVNRRTIEVPRTTANTNRTLHLDGSLEGDFELMDRFFTWSTTFNYSKVDGNTLSNGNLNLVNLKRAMGPSFRNAQGVVQCGTPTAPIALAECVPFDIVGGPSASTSAALNYVNHTGVATYGSSVKSLHVDVTGEIVKLPGGMLAFAAGLEKRDVAGFDRPGQMEQQNLTTDLAARTTTGKFTVDEGYLELNIPVLKGLPFAESLVFNLASRKSDYSNFGNTTNSKASFTFRPIKDVLTRGTWAEGFRAPTLGDTFGGGSQTFDSYLDPCDSVNGEAARDATVKARCTAAGVPVNFRQLNAAGAPVGSGGGQTPFPFSSGAGNAFLTPETAVTKTLGVVFSPSQIAGLTVGFDWYNVTVKDRIVAVSSAFLLNQCYITGITPICGLHSRDATGQVLNLNRGNANLGELETEGFDLSASYRLPVTPFGRFTVRTETTYLEKYRTKSSPTAAWGRNLAGEFQLHRVKSNIGIDWSMGDFAATLGTRYYSPIKTNCWSVGSATVAPQDCSNPTDFWSGGTGYNKLKAQVFNDLNLSYKAPWKGTVMVGINNLLGVKPRINYSASSSFGGPSSSSAVDPDLPLDRFFYVRYTQSF